MLLSLLSGFKPRATDLLAIAYAVIAVASVIWSPSPENSWKSALNAGVCSVILLAVRATIVRKRDYWVLSLSLIAGALLLVGRMVSSFGEFRWVYREIDTRVGVDGSNYNYTAYSFVTVAVIILSLTSSISRRGHFLVKLALMGLFASMYLGIVLNGTRSALLAFAVLAVWWLLSRIRPAPSYVLLVAVFCLANVVALTGWLDSVLRDNVRPSPRETGDLNGRLTTWSVARDYFWEAPVLGHGAGSFARHWENSLGIGAHSAVLDVGTGVGVVGICLFFGALWRAVHHDVANSPLRYLVGGALIAATLPIFLSGFWSESPVLWAAVGLVSRLEVLGAQSRTRESFLVQETRPFALGDIIGADIVPHEYEADSRRRPPYEMSFTSTRRPNHRRPGQRSRR